MRLKNESYPAKLDDFKHTPKGINAPISKDQDIQPIKPSISNVESSVEFPIITNF